MAQRVSQRLRFEFIAAMQREYKAGLGQEHDESGGFHAPIAEACRDLMRLGATYGRLAEMECNDERFGTKEERRQGSIERSVQRILKGAMPGAHAVFSGDPRGNTIKVTVPSGRTDDWGDTGICVPTS